MAPLEHNSTVNGVPVFLQNKLCNAVALGQVMKRQEEHQVASIPKEMREKEFCYERNLTDS